MAVQGIQPFIHVSDANGNPYVGALCYVYVAPTTTTLKAIFSDSALTVALANPLTSNASGRFDRFYMAVGTYKIRIEDADAVLIDEWDSNDTGLSAGSGALPVASGGTGATTAAAARTNLDVPSNTEFGDLTDQITELASSIQNIVSQPQGYLTPTSATPVITTGVTAGTAIYYTPRVGNLVPIYDGTQFNPKVFAELTLTMNAAHVASNIYDVFIFENSGVVTIGTGPAWTTATAGAGARGSGAGTSEITRTNGLWVNTVAITARNGATTYSVAATLGTYVGSIFMDGTNGQISCLTAWGSNRKWSVWNAYNRSEIILLAGDATASWVYENATVRQSNGGTGNKVTVFCGLPEEPVNVTFNQVGQLSIVTSSSPQMINGIGVNSTTVMSGTTGLINGANASGARVDWYNNMVAQHTVRPFIGIHNINALEAGTSQAGTSHTFYGTEATMRLTASWMG